MSSSSSVKYPVECAVEDFQKTLYHSSVALGRLEDFHDETQITEVCQREKFTILLKCKTENANLDEDHLADLLKDLDPRLEDLVRKQLRRNRRHRKQSEAFIGRLMDFLCKSYKTSVEARLSLDPKMKPEELEKLLEDERRQPMTAYQGSWKPGPEYFLLEQNAKFDKKMNWLEKNILDKQRLLLWEPEHDEQGDKELLEQEKAIILAMSTGLKRDLERVREDQVPMAHLEERIKIIHDHLLSKGRKLLKSFPEIYEKLMVAVTRSRDENDQDMSVRHAMNMAEKLHMNLENCFEIELEKCQQETMALTVLDASPRLNPLVVRLSDQGITMGMIINDEFQVLKNWIGSSSTPPYVGLNQERHLVCGPDAMECTERWWIPELFGLKADDAGHIIPSEVTFKLEGKELTQETSIEFFLGLLLRSLKLCAEERWQGYFSKVIIAVPVWFRSTHRLQVKASARIAGFAESRLVNEEMAAVCSFLLESGSERGDLLVLSENFGVVSAVQYHISKEYASNSYSFLVERHCRLNRGETENILKFKLARYFQRGIIRGMHSVGGRGQKPIPRKSVGDPASSMAAQDPDPDYPSAFTKAFKYEIVNEVLMLSDSDWGRLCKDIIVEKKMSAGDFPSSRLIMSGASRLELEGLEERLGGLDHEILYAWVGNYEDGGFRNVGNDWSGYLGNIRDVNKSLLFVNVSGMNPEESEHEGRDIEIENAGQTSGSASGSELEEEESASSTDTDESSDDDSNSDNESIEENECSQQWIKEELTVYQENVMDKTKAIIGRLRAPLALLTCSRNAVATFERNSESIVSFKELECRTGSTTRTFTDPKIAGWIAEKCKNVDAQIISALCQYLECSVDAGSVVAPHIEVISLDPDSESDSDSDGGGKQKRKMSRSPSPPPPRKMSLRKRGPKSYK